MQNFSLLVGRVGLSLLFILSGIAKIGAYRATAGMLVAHGLPPGLLPLVIAVELGGGIAVLCGLATRWAALALFAFCIVAAVLFHGDFSDHAQWLNFMKNLAIAGGYMVLAVHGAGDWSLDAWRRRRRQKQKIFF